MLTGIIPRYTIKTLVPYLALALFIFSAILFMNQFVRIFNTAIMIGASLGWIFYSLIQLMPGVLALSVPMSFQLSMLLTLTQFSERGEILALRAAGFSFRQIAWPLGIMALVLSALMIWVNHWVSPLGFKRFQESKQLLAESLTKLKIEPQTFTTVGEWRIYATSVDSRSNSLYDVILFRHPDGDKNIWTLRASAPKAIFKLVPGEALYMELKNGEMQRMDQKDHRRIIMAKFASYAVSIPFNNGKTQQRDISLTEQTTPQIFKGIKSGRLSEQRMAEYKVEASTRLAVALAPIIFFWISCPLGLAMAKRNRAWGLILSIIILFCFYGAMASGISMGRRIHSLSWWLPMLPDALGLAVGAVLWKKSLKT